MSHRQETQRGTGESNAETAQLQRTLMENGREAARQFVELPLQQSLQLQRSATELFVTGLEAGNWAQRRGIDLARDTMQNYLRTLDTVIRNAEELAEPETSASQQYPRGQPGTGYPNASQRPVGREVAGQPAGQAPPEQGPIPQQSPGIPQQPPGGGGVAPDRQRQGLQPQMTQQPLGGELQQPPGRQPPGRPESEFGQPEPPEAGRTGTTMEGQPRGTPGEEPGRPRPESPPETQ